MKKLYLSDNSCSNFQKSAKVLYVSKALQSIMIPNYQATIRWRSKKRGITVRMIGKIYGPVHEELSQGECGG